MINAIKNCFQRAAREDERELLRNALDRLRVQRRVARAARLPQDHLAELDAEEAAYRTRAKALGAAWA